ncbi:MAG: hypothetical protein ACLQQ4_06645 [Bacteroidia bacterium]
MNNIVVFEAESMEKSNLKKAKWNIIFLSIIITILYVGAVASVQKDVHISLPTINTRK